MSAEIGLAGLRPLDRARAIEAAEAADRERRRKAKSCCGWGGRRPLTPLELREENDRRKTLGMPLLDEDDVLTLREAKKKRKEVGKSDGWVGVGVGVGRGSTMKPVLSEMTDGMSLW